MPKAVKKMGDHLRKECFSGEELTMLAETLQEHADEVFSNEMSHPALQCKKQIWAEVSQKVSAVGTTPCTPKECRKRWDDLRLRVRSILSTNRNIGMATGGGAESPIKLQPWEEICATTIGAEAIHGVGDMERGAPSSADAGTQSDSGDEDSREEYGTPRKKARAEERQHRPSTSRGMGQPAPHRKTKTTPHATAPMCSTAPTTAPTTATSTQVAVTEGTASAASSTVGKTAATAAVSDDEEEDQLHVATPTKGPLHSLQLSPCSMRDTSMHGCLRIIHGLQLPAPRQLCPRNIVFWKPLKDPPQPNHPRGDP
ncbi:myb-related transcription factor, partner of profilin-like [Ambystoma mexicanum]|uniref:myb-related transcription factor, partner of profilin-like n=1 Tax=Ambystoma mexicanum TaxID=8296 RepID=UPI0037E71088